MTKHQAPEVTSEDMAAFGASDPACYLYPGEDQQLERAAFCAGAAWNTRATQPQSLTINDDLAGKLNQAADDIVSGATIFSDRVHGLLCTAADRFQPLSLPVVDSPLNTKPVVYNESPCRVTQPVGDEAIERAAKALYEDWIAEDFNEEYCSWEQLPDKDTWRRRARAALGDSSLQKAQTSAGGEQIAENANCSGDAPKHGEVG